MDLILQIAAAAFGLGGQYFVNQRKVHGFYFWLVSNAALIIFQSIHGFWVFVGLHTVYFAMAVHGIYSWRKQASAADALSAPTMPAGAASLVSEVQLTEIGAWSEARGFPEQWTRPQKCN